MGDDHNVNKETYGRQQPQNQYNMKAQDVPPFIRYPREWEAIDKEKVRYTRDRM